MWDLSVPICDLGALKNPISPLWQVSLVGKGQSLPGADTLQANTATVRTILQVFWNGKVEGSPHRLTFRTSSEFDRLLFWCDYLSNLLSALSGKLNPLPYLQENECSIYWLVKNIS